MLDEMGGGNVINQRVSFSVPESLNICHCLLEKCNCGRSKLFSEPGGSVFTHSGFSELERVLKESSGTAAPSG